MIVVAIFIAFFGSFLAPSSPTLTALSDSYVGPTAGHPLGFDGQGRDVVSRLLAGARTSMLGPLAVVIICMTLGTVLAISAAWRRGAYDTVVSSGLDILFAFPGILLAMLAATVFGAGLVSAALALSVAYTPYVARVLRGAALRERTQQYVDALEVQGASATSICVRHLIPNMMPLIVAQATILFGYAMVDLAAISFLGLGVQPPKADWGVMVSENQAGDPAGLSHVGPRGGSVHRGGRRGVQRLRRAALRACAGGAPVSGPGSGDLLRIEDLTVRLWVEGELRPVLHGVSLAIRAGEALGLVGESGSGKSMTARAVDRLLPEGAEVTGPIRFDGKDVMTLAGAELRRFRAEVAMIFQDPRAHIEPRAQDRRFHDRGAPHEPGGRKGGGGAPLRRPAR